MLYISIVEGLYIIYMFVFFKTRYSLEIGRWKGNPITDFFKGLNIDIKDYIDHPVKKSEEKESQICKFGKDSSFLIFIFLILRHYVVYLKKINVYVIILIFFMCFMNYNALLYMLPIFLVEICLNPVKN